MAKYMTLKMTFLFFLALNMFILKIDVKLLCLEII